MNNIQDLLRLVPLAKSRAGKPKYVAFRVSHIKKIEDLYWFYKKCYSSDNFAKCFFGLLKVQYKDEEKHQKENSR